MKAATQIVEEIATPFLIDDDILVDEIKIWSTKDDKNGVPQKDKLVVHMRGNE